MTPCGPWWRAGPLCRPLPPGQAPRSVLVVDLHLLGDSSCSCRCCGCCAATTPQARIGLVAGPWARALLGDTGLIDEYFTVAAPWVRKGGGWAAWRALAAALRQARRHSWDWGIDVRGDLRNIGLLALAGARRRIAYAFTGGAALLTDAVADDGRLRHIIEHHRDLARHLGMDMSDEESVPGLPRPAGPPPLPRPLTGLHFGGSLPLRRMQAEEALALTAYVAGNPQMHVVLFDAPDTWDINRQVLEQLPASLAGRVQLWHGSLREMMALMGALDQFFGMDSGPAHVAAALGVDTTVFFGPNLPAAVRPWGRNVRVIEHAGLYCRPCDHVHCVNPQRQACLRGLVALVRAGSAPQAGPEGPAH